MEAEVKIVLDKRTKSKKIEGGMTVAIRVTFERKARLYSTGKTLTIEQFETVMSERPRKENKDLRKYLEVLKHKAILVCEKLADEFSFEEFKNLYKGQKVATNSKDVYALFEKNIESLYQEERVKTAISYNTALVQLKKHKKTLTWNEVTVFFLNGFEKTYLRNGKSRTTVGIYLRALRKIVNDAIELGYMDKEKYPFGKNKYVIPKGANIKKALSKDDVKRIISYKSDSYDEMRAKNLWVFSFLCNGMNITDVASLKVEDVKGDFLAFVRRKTTRSNEKLIRVPLLKEAKNILSEYGNKSNNPKDLLFDITKNGVSATQRQKDVDLTIQYINKYIDRIARSLGIEVKVTTYFARHSYATILKRSGVSVEQISEALGHSNLTTTQSYLDSFEDDVKMDNQRNLID